MEYLPEADTVSFTQGNILCCQCGVPIQPNPANMCVACLRTQVDITEGIPKQGVLHFCRNCERYLQPPTQWVACALESRELLTLCLKKLKAPLTKVHLIDAGFVWTEPHSKRIKLKLTIQKEVVNGAILQQVFVVEFVVSNQMCEDCHRVEAKDYWKAVVQVRQKTSHKKTMFYLEQLILKYKAHSNTLSIKEVSDGIDFFYATKQDAKKFVDFLQAVVPCRYKTSEKLLSHDVKNNTYNYKSTFSVEIVPVCKDNIVCLPPKLAQQLGNLNQICVCLRVSTTVHIIDPSTLQIADVTAPIFWRTSFQSLCEPRQLTEYMVLEVEPIRHHDRVHVAGEGAKSQKHLLADVWVARCSDLGMHDSQYHCRTHLGHLLKAGDLVHGFDLSNANVNNDFLNKMKPDRLPDVVLVKKVFDKSKRHRRRNWKLKRLAKELETMDTDSMERDYSEFLEDLEEDPLYRKDVNIYRDAEKLAVESDTEDDDAPRISLQEMLEDLHISEDATGGEGAEMMMD
ncbi:NMD3 [Branchiostoma lanceolatum]|uniref:60S ribosomal export protein NMD3 n=1 Tax=Branchiostoma lanceolatum TaxID=7740 RepID=A0A8J9VJT7_BRALA|nr:NMD3 [Branchiostoma lanceolatum]